VAQTENKKLSEAALKKEDTDLCEHKLKLDSLYFYLKLIIKIGH